MNSITLLGEPVLIVSIGFAAMAYGWIKNMPYLTVGFGAAMIAYAIGGILKEFIHRSRPDTVYVTTMRFKSYSFPSAHAMGAILIYGLLAYLAYQHLPSPWNITIPVLLSIFIVLVGLSRVYLGAHYPSDVVGGWLLGGLALLLIIKYAFK